MQYCSVLSMVVMACPRSISVDLFASVMSVVSHIMVWQRSYHMDGRQLVSRRNKTGPRSRTDTCAYCYSGFFRKCLVQSVVLGKAYFNKLVPVIKVSTEPF